MKLPVGLRPFLDVLSLGLLTHTVDTLASDIPDNFQRENLVAWCVAPPWDAAQRGPQERAALVSELGIGRIAYNWSERDPVDFAEEIRQYQGQEIEYFAFWNEHEEAFALFEEEELQPQIWKINPSPQGATQEERVAAAANRMRPFAERAKTMGSPFGLYNHGGWGGEPANLVAVCKELQSQGLDNVGIVYNFHHGHEHIEGFSDALRLMTPHLLCLNLNGMSDASRVDPKNPETKILPIGSGLHEVAMIQTILQSGYDGPVGIIGHLPRQDVEKSLRDNLNGLEKILETLMETPKTDSE